MFELAPRLRHNLASRTTFHRSTVALACPMCGHDTEFAPRVTLVTCAHCQTPLLRGPDDEQPLPPTTILPFGIPEEAADALLREHVPQARSPEYLLTWATSFVPYWYFSLHVRCPWRNEKTSFDASLDEYVEDSDSGVFEEDIVHRFAAASLDDDRGLLATFTPPTLRNAVPFEPALLADIAIQPVTMGLDDAWTAMRTHVDARVEAAVKKEAGLWVDLPEEMVTNLSDERAALVLVPVFVGTGHVGTSTDRFLVDGHAGKVVEASTPGAGRAARGGSKQEMSPGVALLVLGGIAVVGLLLLWGAFAVGRALLALVV